MAEISRVENWTSGSVTCPRCGNTFTLYFNGGELDEVRCCGLKFYQEAIRYDLVISEEE